MAGGWQPASTNNPGVRQPLATFSCGEYRSWGTAVPGKDLTGYSAHWLFGIPPDPVLLGLLSTAYAPPQILVRKATDDSTLTIQPADGGGSALRFSLLKSDTLTLTPRYYWQQAIVFDPSGNPVMVAEGPVLLTPSLMPLETA